MTTTVHTGPFVYVVVDEDGAAVEAHFTLPSAIQGHAAIVEEEGIDWTPFDDEDAQDMWVNEYDDCGIVRIPLKTSE